MKLDPVALEPISSAIRELRMTMAFHRGSFIYVDVNKTNGLSEQQANTCCVLGSRNYLEAHVRDLEKWKIEKLHIFQDSTIDISYDQFGPLADIVTHRCENRLVSIDWKQPLTQMHGRNFSSIRCL